MAWRNKYGNKKVSVDGIVFDSKKEANRYKELLLLEKAGAIKDLTRQVEFLLIPSQYDNNKCIERKCSYRADFVYFDHKGQLVVEDAKGVRTPEYIIKRKLMLHVHKIRILEV